MKKGSHCSTIRPSSALVSVVHTPLVENKDGRDHFSISSTLLVGAGISTNAVIGKTSGLGMSGFQINPNPGQAVKAGGIFLNPQNILASLMKSAGYKTDELCDHGPLDCLIKT